MDFFNPGGDQAPVSVTANAAKRIAEIIESEGQPDMKLRVSVNGGGCSGFQYSFALDAEQGADDLVIERDGIEVLVDSLSLLSPGFVSASSALTLAWSIRIVPSGASAIGPVA